MSGEQLEPGTLLNDRYRIMRVIGKGGMGTVYQAEHVRLDTILAVKEVRAPQTAGVDSQSLLEQCEHEARFLVKLHHPNLPQVTDAFLENNRFFIIMEYIDGVTLEARQHLVGSEGIPVGTVIEWALQVADVLAYLHSQDPPIIFRDLKPANVMIEMSGRIRLIDFGIARRFQPGAVKDTNLLGSVGYSPPEQFGRHQTDTRTDIYSFGATLHNLLTGRDPSHAPFKFAPVRSLNPAVPDSLSRLIDCCLRLDADARPQSVHEIAMELLTIRDTLPAPVESPPGYPVAVGDAPAVPTLPVSPTPTGPNIILTNSALRNTGKSQRGSQRIGTGGIGSDRIGGPGSGRTPSGPTNGSLPNNGAGSAGLAGRQSEGTRAARHGLWVGVVAGVAAVVGLTVWMLNANAKHPLQDPRHPKSGIQTPGAVNPPGGKDPGTAANSGGSPGTAPVTPSDSGTAPMTPLNRAVIFDSVETRSVSQDPQGRLALMVHVSGVAEGQIGDRQTLAAFFYDANNSQITSQMPQTLYGSADGKLSVATTLELTAAHMPFERTLALPLSAFPSGLTGTLQYHLVAFHDGMRIGQSKDYVPFEASLVTPASGGQQNPGDSRKPDAPSPDSGNGAPANTTTKPPDTSGQTPTAAPTKQPGTLRSSPIRGD